MVLLPVGRLADSHDYGDKWQSGCVLLMVEKVVVVAVAAWVDRNHHHHTLLRRKHMPLQMHQNNYYLG